MEIARINCIAKFWCTGFLGIFLYPPCINSDGFRCAALFYKW